jgi:hypothetical protein
MTDVKAPLAPGYYWYFDQDEGLDPQLVEVAGTHVYFAGLEVFWFLPGIGDHEYMGLTAYGTYVGPLAVPGSSEDDGLPKWSFHQSSGS